MDDNINNQYERICKIIEQEFFNSKSPFLTYDTEACDIASNKYKELITVKYKILYEGYDSATKFHKGQFYNTTKEFLNSIYPCEAYGGQCCLYCKKYGACNGFN